MEEELDDVARAMLKFLVTRKEYGASELAREFSSCCQNVDGNGISTLMFLRQKKMIDGHIDEAQQKILRISVTHQGAQYENQREMRLKEKRKERMFQVRLLLLSSFLSMIVSLATTTLANRFFGE